MQLEGRHSGSLVTKRWTACVQGIIFSVRAQRKPQRFRKSDFADVLTGRVHAQGIVFSVRPPKKSWKNIANLSGGEKTLSSLSLVFALHHYKPTPLYVMDEIDAALGRLHSLQQALSQTTRRWSCERKGCFSCQACPYRRCSRLQIHRRMHILLP